MEGTWLAAAQHPEDLDHGGRGARAKGRCTFVIRFRRVEALLEEPEGVCHLSVAVRALREQRGVAVGRRVSLERRAPQRLGARHVAARSHPAGEEVVQE